MLRKTLFAPLLAASALALTVPAHAAGSEDRARMAIAAAEAKVQTAERLGSATSFPEQAAEARAALAMAREHFERDRNSASVEEAVRAQALAETTIGRLESDKRQALVEERADRNAAVASANQQVISAQQDAEDARARAAAAERSAASSAIEAQAARDQAALAKATEVETTVTTQPRGATRTVTKKTTVSPAD